MVQFRLLSAAIFGVVNVTLPVAIAAPVALHLLEPQSTTLDSGISFGVPWPQGTTSRDARFTLKDSNGNMLPVQTWPLAYWPDGSLKWSGIATVVPAGLNGLVTLSEGVSAKNGELKATQDAQVITIDTGPLRCTVPLRGGNLVETLSIGGVEVARAGKLMGIVQDGPATNPEDAPPREKFSSVVQKVSLEQSGPVRAVVKIEGVHRNAKSGREWLPYSVRLYFYSGLTSIRLVHTIVFDGDQEKDFVRGLGIQFSVPLREAAHNRTVRFAGPDGGLWSEPLQPGGGNAVQESGGRFNPTGSFSQNAIWTDFKLTQPNPDGFSITKRTNSRSAWVLSNTGRRASGYAYVGDLGGGLAIGVRNFWQSFPSALEVNQANEASAELTAWLWSPDGPQMDMRHYDITGHGLSAAYEDVQPGMSKAYGVARTSELVLFPSGPVPARAIAVAQARASEQGAFLASSPEYVHSTGVFGVWSLVDRSTPFKKAIEDGLDSVLAFYARQVDERSWYGFWQFGDFMHSYSAARHVWHYDWGGHAWDNTELGTPLWLWYSYLRSGRADLFRLAEVYTRNTSETNVYHLGEMKGLGSRHNVIKWGDGAKEARISQSAHWRIFYYLTTDERTGDIMREVTEAADSAVARFDPMRLAKPATAGEPAEAARIRVGPDWFALAGNWMTEWERTGDTHWRDRIVAGVDSILTLPYWFNTHMVGFDVVTGRISIIPDPVTKKIEPNSNNLATIQGGAQVMFELVPLLGRKDLETAWLQYCRLGNAPAEVLTKDRETGAEGADGRYVYTGQRGPRLAAFAYAKTKNPAFANVALNSMLSQAVGVASPKLVSGIDSLKPVTEDAQVATNAAAQTGLSWIEFLELCKDRLPVDPPVRRASARGTNQN